ncbi:POK19 protein, partial [Origma solitaria]|nr:POK19 protein [Origma solitaria]
LSEGNARADLLVMPAWAIPPPDTFAQARQSHALLHQSAKMLARHFSIPQADASGIVCSCPDCQHSTTGFGAGVNPRGTQALQLWQMDVTHVSEFGQKRYDHVCIDTYSHALWATPL